MTICDTDLKTNEKSGILFEDEERKQRRDHRSDLTVNTRKFPLSF